MLDERRIAEAHPLAVRTREALRLIGAVRFARIEQIEIGARQDALHRMVAGVSRTGGALLVADGAQIVVIADQAFVAAAAKVALQARVAADTCRATNSGRNTCVRVLHTHVQIRLL